MTVTALSILAFTAYLVAALFLLAYRKNGARHRHAVSWLAWLLLVVLGGSAIELALSGRPASPFDAGRAVLLCLFVCATRGNVARLLRS
ncbi:phage holin family protein [Cupriavidus sp. UGS-1]|uniref:phage holin family protein n=1 Tax=Cupriavidus sp. UGS-1 TaxID=2899826 RepID=UPI001E429B5B|nr:phage holin family protein [Cupriavidus sp. UGS-1]MCD9124028.1 phage holin family protein [Cupriavidus sp. UGS-1]